MDGCATRLVCIVCNLVVSWCDHDEVECNFECDFLCVVQYRVGKAESCENGELCRCTLVLLYSCTLAARRFTSTLTSARKSIRHPSRTSTSLHPRTLAPTHPRIHASTPSFGFFSFLPLASAFLRSTPFAFCHFWCHSLFFSVTSLSPYPQPPSPQSLLLLILSFIS